MKVGLEREFHLTYCSNIHPGESWDEVFARLQEHAVPLKKELSPDEPFGLGLRLSNEASVTLLESDHLDRFGQWLTEQDMYVFTLNGFPYGSFHRSIVKDSVYKPDWRTQERVDYTKRLIRILAALLPKGITGGISTSPLSYKPWLTDERAREDAFAESTKHLVDITEYLVDVRSKDGTFIHIDIEPEPDCLIENTAETIAYFTEWLFPRGGEMLADRIGLGDPDAVEYLRDHIRLCYDTCHFAVEYERANEAMQAVQQAGIRIGKVQISAAIRVPLPDASEELKAVAARLEPFAESTYLHQVIERNTSQGLVHYPDLPDALPHIQSPHAKEWRIHFHVPIFVDSYNDLFSTQSDIEDTLMELRRDPRCSHLEIETYTWDVLPEGLKQDLTTSIRREYEWVLKTIHGQ